MAIHVNEILKFQGQKLFIAPILIINNYDSFSTSFLSTSHELLAILTLVSDILVSFVDNLIVLRQRKRLQRDGI